MGKIASSLTHLTNNFWIYLELSKWRVISLMLVTVWVGMSLASPTLIPPQLGFSILLGIGFVASAAGSLNHLLDHHLDCLMARTERRPLPQGKISPIHVLLFALVIGLTGLTLLYRFTNLLTTLLSLLSLIGYAFIYTLFLKRRTTQSIVIGGLAGATPPLLGWTAITGHIEPGGLLLVLIIFTWTPAHFWSLAIAKQQDYAKTKLPMLPVTHGISFTKQQILLYIFLLSAASLLPFSIGMSGLFYLSTALLLDIGFIVAAYCLLKETKHISAIGTFHYSNFYLLMLFMSLLIDHFLMRSN